MADQPTEKKKKPGIMSSSSERMGLANDQPTLQAPSKLQVMAQGSPLGMMMQQNMPNMADIALSQRTNNTNLGLGQEAGGDQMEKVKNSLAKQAGKDKNTLFGQS